MKFQSFLFPFCWIFTVYRLKDRQEIAVVVARYVHSHFAVAAVHKHPRSPSGWVCRWNTFAPIQHDQTLRSHAAKPLRHRLCVYLPYSQFELMHVQDLYGLAVKAVWCLWTRYTTNSIVKMSPVTWRTWRNLDKQQHKIGCNQRNQTSTSIRVQIIWIPIILKSVIWPKVVLSLNSGMVHKIATGFQCLPTTEEQLQLFFL